MKTKLGLVAVMLILAVAVAFIAGYRLGDQSSRIDSAQSQKQDATQPHATTTLVEKAKEETASIDSELGNTPSPSPSQEQEATQASAAQQDPTASAPHPTQAPTMEDLTEEEAMELLREIWDLLDNEFYGEMPPPQDRIYGAIRGMLETLDDDYTSFLEPTIAEIERTDASGSFEGIGALVGMTEDDVLEIVRPFEGQPADKAGLLPGDRVLAVDGESIAGLGIYEAIALIRGPEGQEVVLTVQREAGTEPFDVSIVRARIDIPIVESRMLEEQIGYVSLFDFSSQATSQLEEHIEELKDQGAEALVFDLRSNPGGYLDQAVQVSDLFLDEGLVLIERISDGQERRFTSDDKGIAQDIPLVVLVNGGSASASEIVAGAIQDRERGILIGETTFGKGSVQLPHTLSDGSELRVTVARWFTPNDRAIHGEGLNPDIEVEVTPEDIEAERDAQLERAIEYLKER